MTTPNVFISYSHKDEHWKDKLLPQLRALEQAGVAMKVWEDRQIDAGAKWYPEIQQAIEDTAVAILLISAHYLSSGFCIKEEVPFLIQRQEHGGMLLIPILIRACPWKAHRWLADRQMLPRDGKCVAIDFPGDQADAVFSEVAERVFSHFKALTEQPETASALPKAVQKHIHSIIPLIAPVAEPLHQVQPWPALAPDRIDLTRLPETGAALFGRDEELKFLDDTWSQSQPSICVVAFVAQGGVGKSTLVNCWLDEMKRDQFRGATRVFGWSFYSQGVREQGGTSADTFIAAALRFFGDADPLSGSPWDKGDRLARLVGAERALLILDGVEPLQSSLAFDRGKVRDPALERLLRGLVRQSHGLCLITSREPLTDLARRPGYAPRDLDQITPQAGRALLRTARVVGTDQELETLAKEFGPHALAISLLGVYLHEQPGHGIDPARALAKLSGKTPVEHVLAGFEQWLGDSPEYETLRLVGFFDRPVDDGCLAALRQEPAIEGLTDRLVKLKQGDWSRVLIRLEKLRLIHLWQGESGTQFVDAHPLLREYFAKQLRENNLDTWRAGHKRIYKHLCETTKEGDQPTLEDLQPLFDAVRHGCQAGSLNEALEHIYRDRILRGFEINGFYSTRKLGAFGPGLGAIACFFDQPWKCVSPTIDETAQAWLLHQAAFHLHALGQLTAAIEPMRAALEALVKNENWEQATIGATNLAELELTLGDVLGAIQDAERAETYAERSGSTDWKSYILSRTTLAGAIHQAGEEAKALPHFFITEKTQQEQQSNYPLHYSLRGFRYCDLLLTVSERAAWQVAQGLEVKRQRSDLISECRAVSQRAAQTLKWAEMNARDILSAAFDYLTLGRALLYESILQSSAVYIQPSTLEHLETALNDFHRAGQRQYVPLGLLTSAWLRAVTDNHSGAQVDLDEAWEIAERGPMQLHMADIHLYRARLFFRENKYPWESPAADLAAARKLIEQCGYGRRKEELEDAEDALRRYRQ